jgi:hypothetical protein
VNQGVVVLGLLALAYASSGLGLYAFDSSMESALFESQGTWFNNPKVYTLALFLLVGSL